MQHVVSIFLLLLHFSGADIIEKPADAIYRNQQAISGTLTCKVSIPVDDVFSWTVGKRGIVYIEGGQDYYPDEYAYTADTATGVFTMTIRNLGRDDSNEYACQYGKDRASATIIVAGKFLRFPCLIPPYQ